MTQPKSYCGRIQVSAGFRFEKIAPKPTIVRKDHSMDALVMICAWTFNHGENHTYDLRLYSA